MKTVKFILILALAGAATLNPAKADGGDESSRVIYVESAKYTLPLVEKWIAEYNRTNPGVQVRHAGKDAAEADLRIVARAEAEHAGADDGQTIVYVGRSALLPVTTKENPLYAQISKRKFGKKELKKLFFSDDPFDEESDGKDPLQHLTVYSGNGATSGASLFASHFGQLISGFRGKKILGDDIYLLQAIHKDPTGVTFNNLSYIYDLKDRQLKDEITLLPLQVRKEQSDIIRSENLDETLSLLENEKIELVPVHHIGFAFAREDRAKDFLKWILAEGQQFNHEFGFLRLDEKTRSHEQKQFGNNLLTNK